MSVSFCRPPAPFPSAPFFLSAPQFHFRSGCLVTGPALPPSPPPPRSQLPEGSLTGVMASPPSSLDHVFLGVALSSEEPQTLFLHEQGVTLGGNWCRTINIKYQLQATVWDGCQRKSSPFRRQGLTLPVPLSLLSLEVWLLGPLCMPGPRWALTIRLRNG